MDFLKVKTEKSFKEYSLKLFNFHYDQNKNYRKFCSSTNVNRTNIDCINKIPFIPIVFFKKNKICIDKISHQKIFKSSGTGGAKSSHFIHSLDIYNNSIEKCFERIYGRISNFVIIGVTPHYNSKTGSSLIYMINELIKKSNKKESQFLRDINEFDKLTLELEKQNRRYIIYGLSYAILDLLEEKNYNLRKSIIIETGGMKGLRDEIEKEALHKIISDGFNTPNVHSEYAMTELLSQSYSIKNQVFSPPPWKKVLIRDFNDPFKVHRSGRGFLNIIDLANKYSCPFISTEDLGEVFENGDFKILGRGSESDLRGCNLMLTDYTN